MIYALVDLVESKLLVPALDLIVQVGGLPQHELIDCLHLIKRNAVLLRIEVVKIPEHILE